MQVYVNRRAQLLQAMQDKGITIGFVSSPSNVYYLTGIHLQPHERFMALAFDVSRERMVLFVPTLDMEIAGTVDSQLTVVGISDTEDAYAVVAQHVSLSAEAPQAHNIGVEFGLISYARGLALQERYDMAPLVDVQPLLNAMRLIKSSDEIIKVRAAIQLAEQVLEQALSVARIGMTEQELMSEIELGFRRGGGERPAFATIVLSGTRSALPHGVPNDTRFMADEFLLIDMGVYKDGYCSDITRTFLWGEGKPEQISMYNTVLQANLAAIAAVRDGCRLGELDRAARAVIEEAGYGAAFNHRVGHGLGIDIHEEPSIHGDNEGQLCPGMLFTIEPGVYLPHLGGVRIEDDVWINASGEAEVLTSFPKTLRHLPV